MYFLEESLDSLPQWGRVTHICVSDLTSNGSDNGLSPGRRQAIIRTNARILLIRPLGTNFSDFLVEILIVSFKKMRVKVSSAKRRPFCFGLNELRPRKTIDAAEVGQHKRENGDSIDLTSQLNDNLFEDIDQRQQLMETYENSDYNNYADNDVDQCSKGRR